MRRIFFHFHQFDSSFITSSYRKSCCFTINPRDLLQAACSSLLWREWSSNYSTLFSRSIWNFYKLVVSRKVMYVQSVWYCRSKYMEMIRNYIYIYIYIYCYAWRRSVSTSLDEMITKLMELMLTNMLYCFLQRL